MWFDSWESVGTVLLKGIVGYAFIVFVLRITGKRTLSKMNAFDLIVTVAIGSTLASVLLSSDVTVAEGATALALLVVLQYGVTWVSVRAPFFQRVIKAEPRLLFYQAQFLDEAMKKERVTREEVWAAARASGIAGMDDIVSIVLETDGTLSIVRGPADGAESTLRNVTR